MNDKEVKRNIVLAGGGEAGDEITQLVITLAVKRGLSIDEACSSIIKAMQFLSEGVDKTLKQFAKALIETCESCIRAKDRRTRHGSSSRTEKPRKARITINWWEKYRPP